MPTDRKALAERLTKLAAVLTLEARMFESSRPVPRGARTCAEAATILAATCETCRHFGAPPWGQGACALLSYENGADGILVEPTFGCFQHQPREEPT